MSRSERTYSMLPCPTLCANLKRQVFGKDPVELLCSGAARIERDTADEIHTPVLLHQLAQRIVERRDDRPLPRGHENKAVQAANVRGHALYHLDITLRMASDQVGLKRHGVSSFSLLGPLVSRRAGGAP